FGHVDPELRTRPAILRHRADNSGCAINLERHVFAIAAYAGHLAESQQRARIGVEDVAQVAGIIAPRALELIDPPLQKPVHHCPSPVLGFSTAQRTATRSRAPEPGAKRWLGGRPAIDARALARLRRPRGGSPHGERETLHRSAPLRLSRRTRPAPRRRRDTRRRCPERNAG